MDTKSDVERLRANARRLAEREGATLLERTGASRELYERARTILPLGVASSFQTGEPYPYPLYVERGSGAEVWDADGTRYLDVHNGFGVTLCGHAHPAIVRAIERAATTGTHFAAMTAVGVDLADELRRRFHLERVRFANSGTEATMEAIRIARAATGRSVVVKVEGCYHGHHDTVMFSVAPGRDALAGDGGVPKAPIPFSKGIPRSVADELIIVPFNDPSALEEVLRERGTEIAAFITEPVMMFAGIVLPEPGYLERVRELCTRYAVVLIFDEVKTGVNIAPGGATERFGVLPDLACFAKAIGGGVPIGAFGGKADVMGVIERGEAHLGTFNGNPLAMHAGLATLTEVLTPDAHRHLEALGTRIADGCRTIVAEHGIPAHVVDLSAKGGVCYRRAPLRNYRDAFDCDDDLLAASSPWMLNRGVFQIPGDKGQWMLSVQHTEEDIERYLDAFAGYCAELTA